MEWRKLVRIVDMISESVAFCKIHPGGKIPSTQLVYIWFDGHDGLKQQCLAGYFDACAHVRGLLPIRTKCCTHGVETVACKEKPIWNTHWLTVYPSMLKSRSECFPI